MLLNATLACLNLVIPGVILHRVQRHSLGFSIWASVVLGLALLSASRIIFTPLGASAAALLIVLAVCISTAVATVSKGEKSFRASPALLHVTLAFSVMAAVAFNAKSWLAFEFHYVPTDSMAPTIQPHDVLLSDTSERARATLTKGDVLVFAPQNGQKSSLWVKRLADQNPKGLYVLGDNTLHSYDSRRFGRLDPDQVQAVARWVIGHWDGDTFKLQFRSLQALR